MIGIPDIVKEDVDVLLRFIIHKNLTVTGIWWRDNEILEELKRRITLYQGDIGQYKNFYDLSHFYCHCLKNPTMVYNILLENLPLDNMEIMVYIFTLLRPNREFV